MVAANEPLSLIQRESTDTPLRTLRSDSITRNACLSKSAILEPGQLTRPFWVTTLKVLETQPELMVARACVRSNRVGPAPISFTRCFDELQQWRSHFSGQSAGR